MYTISRTNRDNPDFRELIKELDSYLNGQYNENQSQYDIYNGADSLDAVVVASEGDNPVGCGAFRRIDEQTVEIKRMFVQTDFRQNGVGGLIMEELESWAIEDGYSAAVLETGEKQPEAKSFYENHGYTVIPNYPPYDKMPGSICMRKELI